MQWRIQPCPIPKLVHFQPSIHYSLWKAIFMILLPNLLGSSWLVPFTMLFLSEVMSSSSSLSTSLPIATGMTLTPSSSRGLTARIISPGELLDFLSVNKTRTFLALGRLVSASKRPLACSSACEKNFQDVIKMVVHHFSEKFLESGENFKNWQKFHFWKLYPEFLTTRSFKIEPFTLHKSKKMVQFSFNVYCIALCFFLIPKPVRN